MAQCGDNHEMTASLLSMAATLKGQFTQMGNKVFIFSLQSSYAEGFGKYLTYLSLTFLRPHQFSWGELNIVCGAHIIENDNKFNSNMLFQKQCLIYATRYRDFCLLQKVVPAKLFINAVVENVERHFKSQNLDKSRFI